MQKMYLIVNLVAGRTTIAEKLGDIIDLFTKAGYEVTVHPTQDGGDAARSAEFACGSGFDIIVCAGGDGTLSQCLQGIMHSAHRLPIGYIPAGSTNDFARSLGIPKTPLEAAISIINGKPVPCDVGGFNGDYFSYIVAFGAFTNISYETPQPIKNLLGHTAYVLNGLTQLTSIRAKRMRVEFGDTVIEDDFIYGMVTNSASVAGLLSMKDFLPDDGLFEVLLIKKPANVMQLQEIVRSLLNINIDIDKDYIKFFRTDKITFTSLGGEEISWTRDGEYGGGAAVNTIVNYNRAVAFMINDEDRLRLAKDGQYDVYVPIVDNEE
ncbi:MAG: YegS/Rv2252/BmrU family lipid kinase [Ruminococcus sp.]|nr:YegS/Rv2252/BmrU family lipid kinase [Ruminococcus sp.]